MKKYIVISICILSMYIAGIHQSFAGGARADATIIGTSSGQNAGNITFSTGPKFTDVTHNFKWAYIGTNNNFYGYFWIENVGWATFGSGATSYAYLTAPTGTTFTMSGHAWSENAGWIAFKHDTTLPAYVANTTFDSTTGRFSGYAWSENLGWIDMSLIGDTSGEGVDIIPPTLSGSFNSEGNITFAADNNKELLINDVGGLYDVELTFWDIPDKKIINGTGSIFYHDFRTAKEYDYKITDTAGNYSTGVVHVVANAPDNTKSSFSLSNGITIIANGSLNHTIGVQLRDIYNNRVVNDSTIGKVVTVNVDLTNQINKNQMPTTSPLKLNGGISEGLVGVLNISGTDDFGLVSKRDTPSLIGSNNMGLNGDYSIKISSKAPTNTDNKLVLNSLNYTIISNIPGTGQATGTPISSPVNFTFTPAFGVSYMEISGGGWNSITLNNSKSFTGTYFYSGSFIESQKVANIFDVSSDTIPNYFVSLQDPTNYGFYNGYFNQDLEYVSSNPLCSYSGATYNNSSNTYGNNTTFTWTPKNNGGFMPPTSMSINYSSLVVYTNSGVTVGHKSLAYSGASGGTITTNQIKIAGNTNMNDKSMLSRTGSNMSIVGTLTKNDIKTTIYKNVELLTKGGKSSGSIKYKTTDLTLNGWSSTDSNPVDSSIDTVIVKGADVFITGNIPKVNGKVKGIVVLKDSDGNGGNIYVAEDVKFIAAAIFADGGLISGEKNGAGIKYYADSESDAQDQMAFKGIIISNNTIGGSYKNPATCPYGVASCDLKISMRYDLNLFRHFINGVQGDSFSGFGIDMGISGYANAPIIIEYDSDIQRNSPKVFQVK